MAMAALKLTEDQLRAAWLARRRRDWPPTFEGAMDDRILSRVVRIEAQLRAHQCAPSAQPARHHHAQRPALPALPSKPPVLDHKRRAAGERDDD